MLGKRKKGKNNPQKEDPVVVLLRFSLIFLLLLKDLVFLLFFLSVSVSFFDFACLNLCSVLFLFCNKV